ncbi:macrolide-specific efflux system membrane fusion protein [Azospirillum fermentarium]|uniref:efflux RND transporter periplasmic adaptor subunit n=1 Tax=Azospirillum fermentarium TaxID=1233114 RepID=UPI0022279D44|nr:efflux RND transporter periplasmic adaptor subunit [Azospirillum fermentarium]MCW2244675.1 macrolide-specific efflux system membrane fusion protein [Azospirillum fermentarium]
MAGWIKAGAAAAVIVAGAGGTWWYMQASASTPTAVRTHTVALGTIEETVSAVGTLQPRTYVDVGTQVSGQLKRIFVEAGDRVEQGQLLAQIDPTVYEARVAADQAQLMSLRAQLKEKHVQLELAEKQFERQRRLMDGRATSQEAYDSADAQRKSASAQIGVLEAQIQQVESTLKGDQANLSYTKIYAPMTGTVVDVSARQGQTLNANQQAPIILRIAELSTMTVKTQVSEADIPKLKVGMHAYFTTLGQPDRRRSGTLNQVLPTPEVTNNVVLYSSLFDVPNPDNDLMTQMSAHVFFVVAEAKGVPTVPAAALLPRPGGKFAVKLMAGGEVVERRVEVGVTNRVTAEIRSGLSVGDQVVIEAQRNVAGGPRPNMMPPDGGPPPGGPPPGAGMGMTGGGRR